MSQGKSVSKGSYGIVSFCAVLLALAIAPTALGQNPHQLAWGSYIGGSLSDGIRDGVVDGDGNLVIVGWTDSEDFPITAGAYQETFTGPGPLGSARAGETGFMMKFDPVGNLLFSSFFGGSGYENIMGVALDGNGDICIAGTTTSADLPTTAGAYDTTHNGGEDAFVAKLSADGSTLLWCTYVGGSDNDTMHETDTGGGIALDAAGNIYIVGATWSTDFPATSGAFASTHGGDKDGFAAKLSADGTALHYATFLGGTGSDRANDCVVTDAGALCVVGDTASSDFPTTGSAVQPADSGAGSAAFALKLDTAGSALVFGTYLGGSSSSSGKDIALDPSSGAIYVGGRTTDTDFPTTSLAFDTTLEAGGDCYVAKLSGDGTAIEAATLLGGDHSSEAVLSIRAVPGGVWVAGDTRSANFPTTSGAYQTMSASAGIAEADAFAALLTDDLASLEYGTHVGGSGYDPDGKVVFGINGEIYVLTLAGSLDIPTTANAFDFLQSGHYEGYVAKIAPARGPGLYELIDLGTLGGTESAAHGLNENGEVTGMAHTASGVDHAFYWTESGGMVNLGTLGGSESEGWDINDLGEIVGQSFVPGGQLHAFYWNGTTMTDIDPAGGASSFQWSGAWQINNAGQVVGWTSTTNPSRGFLTDLNTSLTIFDLPDSEWYSITDASAEHGPWASGFRPGSGSVQTHPSIYDVDADAHTSLPGLGGWRSQARGANRRGMAVGLSRLPFSNDNWPIVGDYTGGFAAIAPEAPHVGGRLLKINDGARAVGNLNSHVAAPDGIIWDVATGVTALTSLLDPVTGDGWRVNAARDINESGWIVGAGEKDGETHAILLRPLDGDADGLTYREERDTYGTDPNNPDTDGDGVSDGDEVALGRDPLVPDNDPELTLTSPNGGETLYRGGLWPITWESAGPVGDDVMLIARRGPQSAVIAPATPNDGSYDWTVPTSYPWGPGFTVEVRSVDDPNVFDGSDGTFFISNDPPPPADGITVTSPNGGEDYQPGGTLPITWDSFGNVGSDVQITLHGGSGSETLAASTPNDGGFDWAIPSGQTTGSDYTVEVTSLANPSISDTSDGPFSIGDLPSASITVTAPNGGETVYRGFETLITWTSTGDVGGSVRILARRGAQSAVIAHVTPNDGVYEWTVPSNYPYGPGFTIEISSVSDPSILDGSDANFTVSNGTPPPTDSITVTAPNGGEVFAWDETVSITWNSDGAVGTDVEIVLHKGGVPTTLAASTPNDGVFEWTVPNGQALGADYTVEVISLANSGIRGTSDGPFTIADTPPPVANLTLTSPNGGETLERGGQWTITWTSEGEVGDSVRIIARRGAQSAVIVHNTPNDGSYEWAVPTAYPYGPGFTIEINSVDNPGIADGSDGTFFIDP